MSVLLTKILWFRVGNPTVGINMTDSVDMNVGRGLDIKNNTVSLNVKNSAQSFNANGNIVYRYVGDDGDILFKENDQIKIYVRYTDDMADVENAVWDKTTTSEPSSDYLKGVYYIQNVNNRRTLDGTSIKLDCADKSFILFNRLLPQAFTISEEKTAPEIIQKVVRFSSPNQDGLYRGSGEDPGVFYDVDARLTTETDGGLDNGEAGFIQNTRRNTKEDGSVNSITTFPDIAMAKIWKPVYEWIGELSQIENLNTEAELASTLVYGRPFIFWVDENNKFHWVETNDTVTASDNITIGTTTGIISHGLHKSIFDVNNFIVFRGGEDFFGNGTLGYYIDPTTNVSSKKMRVVAMIDIAKVLIQAEKAKGNLVANTSGTFTFSGNRYNRNGTVTPEWTTDSFSNDNDYNNSLRDEINREGTRRSRNLVIGLSSARYRGPIDRKGVHLTVGNLLTINDSASGIINENIRTLELRDTINKNGWFTQQVLEQDSTAIIEGA